MLPDNGSVNLAFSRQALSFDETDAANPVLQEWRVQIYRHVGQYLKPGARILELNAGTGIDALHFARAGHSIHATDLSDGMIRELERKIKSHPELSVSCQQISVESLDHVAGSNYDFAFSNFGGLNCVSNLKLVAPPLANKLRPGAYLTWVIMPPFCPWELLWLFKGKWSEAIRRFYPDGSIAHLEGESFKIYYHSLADVRKAFGKSFTLIRSEGLGVFSAPPSAAAFLRSYPSLYKISRSLDLKLKDLFPFNRWGDHIIVTLRKKF
jgi:Methyltransferase domain